MKKLSLNKEIISSVTKEEMNKIAGGIEAPQEECDLWGSRVTCTTNFNTGGCGKSQSCNGPICIPF